MAFVSIGCDISSGGLGHLVEGGNEKYFERTSAHPCGEVPQYYVDDSHPAIIKPEEWEAVQVEMEQRRSKGRRHDCSSPFSGKILCGDCGGVYGSKTWHATHNTAG